MKNSSTLCEYCRRIFRGHWQEREDSIHSVDRLSEDESDVNQFYERPDWLHIDKRSDSGTGPSPSSKASSPVHHSIPALETSAESGCHLCVIIWDQLRDRLQKLRKEWGDDLKRATGVAVVRPATDFDEDAEPSQGSDSMDLEILYFLDGECEKKKAYVTTVAISIVSAKCKDIITSSSTAKVAADFPRGFDETPSSSTEPSFTTIAHIRKWIDGCTQSHADCKSLGQLRANNSQSQLLPSRLLDVGTEQGMEFIRLKEGQDIDNKEKYMTLSHCWGSHLPIRLMKASRQRFRQSIAISALPTTFQDAVRFTRFLKVKYIWIDSLCIIQDSRDDWLRESLRMSSIYANSWLNVAATSSPDSHGGLFKMRNKMLSTRCQVEASWTGHLPGVYLCLDPSGWTRKVEEAPLSTRGWVYQERLLAPRNIHFASDQLWWECREARACETFVDGIPDYEYFGESRKAQLLAELDPKDLHDSNEVWLGIANSYMKTKLTRDSDRLIALAGVASTVSDVLGWAGKDYYAGLWKHDLSVNLLWRMAAQGTRPKEYNAPSWSWASVKGEVYFHSSAKRAEFRENILVKVEEVKSFPTGGPFGPVTDAFLRIRGSLNEIRLSGVEDSAFGPYFSKLQLGSWSFTDDDMEEGLDDNEAYVQGSKHPLCAYFCRFATIDTPNMDRKYTSEGLILKLVDQVEAKYRRVGWMRIFHDEKDLPFQTQDNAAGADTFRIV